MRSITRCLAAVFALALLSASSARANMLMNGDFENSLFNPGACLFNWPNPEITTNVPGIIAYGALSSIDFTKAPTSCGWGPPPQGGVAKLTIDRAGLADEFSIIINSGVVAGTDYALTFYASCTPNPNIGQVDIGLSNSATAFGTLVYTSPTPSTTTWTPMFTSFQAPVNASYLTVRVTPGALALIHLDTFSLEEAIVGVGDGPEVEFGVRAAPNPSRGAVDFLLRSPVDGRAVLAIHDVSGRRLATVLDRSVEPGVHHVTWSGRDEAGRPVAAGLYFYRLTLGTRRSQGTLVIAR